VADRTHGADYLLLGDAYTFIDPVFSSGVWLAMHSAVAGAEAIDCVLRDPVHAAAALRRFDRSVRRGPRQFSWFIYRVTTPSIRELFMNPRNPLRMKEALLSVLAGDIYGRTPIRAAALNAFKAIYYLTALLHPRLSIDAWRRRRRNLREAPAAVQPGS
jgi:2-polyprenyl-6-methoxyphenol hydroxylase-like FAD-dependent oxidoreductase